MVYELVRAHRARGDTVVVMASGFGWLSHEVVSLGAEYVQNPFMKKTYNLFTLIRAGMVYRKSVRKYTPDIVSVHNSFSGVIGRVFRVWSIPLVYTTHGWGFNYSSVIAKYTGLFTEWLCGFMTDALVCVSRSDAQTVVHNHLAPKDKIHLIYNGVSIGDTSVRPTNTPSIIFVGRFAHPKQQDCFVEACALLSDHLLEQLSIEFVGSGPTEVSVTRKVEEKGLATHTTFYGAYSRAQTLAQIASSWAIVLLSESEGLPMVVIEALQLGVPVVASAVGGIPEIVDDTVGKLLPKNATPQQVATAMEHILTDTQKRNELSRAAKDRGEKFSADRMAAETISLYESLI